MSVYTQQNKSPLKLLMYYETLVLEKEFETFCFANVIKLLIEFKNFNYTFQYNSIYGLSVFSILAHLIGIISSPSDSGFPC